MILQASGSLEENKKKKRFFFLFRSDIVLHFDNTLPGCCGWMQLHTWATCPKEL